MSSPPLSSAVNSTLAGENAKRGEERSSIAGFFPPPPFFGSSAVARVTVVPANAKAARATRILDDTGHLVSAGVWATSILRPARQCAEHEPAPRAERRRA